MSKDPEIDALYDRCNTLPELRRELAVILNSRGLQGEKWVNVTVTALLGGTTAYTRPDGEYENKWRRKFQCRIDVEQEEKLAA